MSGLEEEAWRGFRAQCVKTKGLADSMEPYQDHICCDPPPRNGKCYLLYDWDYDEPSKPSLGFQIRNTEIPFHNGANSLLYDYDFDDNVDEMTLGSPYRRRSVKRNHPSEMGDRLSPEEAKLVLERIKGLYSELKYDPELMNRRLQVGSHKPQIPKEHIFNKRAFSHLSSSPVCPAHTEWRLLRMARDLNDTEVEVFQPGQGSTGHQWFYTTSCNFEMHGFPFPDCPRCCRGISRHQYHSRCLTRKSFVMALVRKHGDRQYDWNWIQIDTACTCAISPV